MKQLRSILIITIISVIGIVTFAQTKPVLKTETFKVFGNCELCKSRIEKALKIEGVASADWVIKTKMLTVTFDPKKTNSELLGKKLAAVGHDTEKIKSTDVTYSKLPGCCHYERP